MDTYKLIENPFNVTKATDFTNEQIATYWVDFYTANGEDIGHYLNPKDLTPKYIIGGKGCGKTHLLRYFSFPLQKLRSGNIKLLLEKDQYLGINIDLGAMNSARMHGNNIAEDQWDVVFGYYLELYSGIHFLDILINIFKELKIEKFIEEQYVSIVKDQICFSSNVNIGLTLIDLREHINEIKKEVDYHINNSALTRKLDSESLKVKFSPGDFFYILPKILNDNIEIFKNIKYIFILDELEKLREYQKIYINTLVWDKKRPSTFWIGARTFGFTTRKTKSDETLRKGSEYQEIRLDDLMREDEDRYYEFSISLCAKRVKSLIKINTDLPTSILQDKIDLYFEPFDEQLFFKSLFENDKKELPHIRHIKEKIKHGIRRRLLRGINQEEIDSFIDKYIKDENILHEKYKTFHFYRQWAKSNSIDQIKESFDTDLYENDGELSKKMKNYEEKYKIDFIAQLIFENNLKLYNYTGLINLIKISSGNPRAFLVLLKEIFERAALNNEEPFNKNKRISVQTQSMGIYNASKWFYEDTEAYGDDGKNLYKCIYNLAALFQGIRFSDKPSETSPSAFSYKPEKLSNEAGKFIQLAVNHRILVPIKDRHDKNSDRVEQAFQINRMLAPYFNIPISRRGIVPLNETFMESIFNPTKHVSFQTLYNDYIGRMNAPFNQETQPEIF